jgi:hypothetical protein
MKNRMNAMRNPRDYMRTLLWLRGFRGRDRLAEAMELALHLLSVHVWGIGAPLPEDWRRLRPVLDHVVYLVVRELRQSRVVRFDGGWPPEDADGLDDQAGGEELACWAIEAVERLEPRWRLVCKLKHAGLFYPAWEGGRVAWRRDEAEYLIGRHRGRSLTTLMEEFRSRVAAVKVRQRGKVPAAVIAWLLGRGSADAVDNAYRTIMGQLRNAAPAGADFVSNLANAISSHGSESTEVMFVTWFADRRGVVIEQHVSAGAQARSAA